MNPFENLDQESLLDTLAEYYHKYRDIVERTWNEKEFNSCRDTLLAVLTELNRRKGYDFENRKIPHSYDAETTH
jgi:hypothetical protein